ncbi:MAG: DoxX family protein [Bacteroidetes bacterium]|jgi:putative oxidoreductase|nr:DoxX family protein [Bacteroidota bacterium]
MRKILSKYEDITNKGQDVILLLLRLILAYGFWEPAKNKWADINAIAEWFAGMGMPLPKLNAYLAATTEMAGVFLLTLGLATRIISLPLIITMIVAIKTVHWENGFPSSDNGYEIPLYYILMLLVLMTFGAGRISVDFLIKKFVK